MSDPHDEGRLGESGNGDGHQPSPQRVTDGLHGFTDALRSLEQALNGPKRMLEYRI
jgi:hypothetical protein